jgi:hypothetical protein
MRTDNDAGPRTAVPADIDTPDKIVFGLTSRQVAVIGGAAVTGWVLYRLIGTHLPPTVLVVAAVPLAGLTIAVALGRRDGLAMDSWLAAAWRLRRTPRLQAPAGAATGHPTLVATVGTPPVPGPLRLPADAITPAGLVQVGDTSAAVVAAGTVNLGLRTGDEQAALLDGFARWLNSLTAPAQIVVSTQRVDLGPAAARIEESAPRLPHPALQAAAVDHAEFLRDLARSRDPLRRHVLLVVRADPRDRGGAARRGEETARALTALGVHARVLDGPSYTAALAAAADPYAPPVPELRATPDQIITAADTWS